MWMEPPWGWTRVASPSVRGRPSGPQWHHKTLVQTSLVHQGIAKWKSHPFFYRGDEYNESTNGIQWIQFPTHVSQKGPFWLAEQNCCLSFDAGDCGFYCPFESFDSNAKGVGPILGKGIHTGWIFGGSLCQAITDFKQPFFSSWKFGKGALLAISNDLNV